MITQEEFEEIQQYVGYLPEEDVLVRKVSSGGKSSGTKIINKSGSFAINNKKYWINTVKTWFSGIKYTRNSQLTIISDPVTQSELKTVLEYNRDTGTFIWIENRGSNAVIGQLAGRVTANGYSYIKIGGKPYMAHRLAWLHEYGKWPTYMIDHINRNKLDNRIDNLRDVPRSLNALNSNTRSDNTSGRKGVHKSGKRWKAAINYNTKEIIIGYFDTFEEAVNARENKEEELMLGELC